MAARSARDATYSGPRGPRRAARSPSPAAALARSLFARPGRVVAICLFVAAGGAIGVNALAFQTARHPAPLFGAAGQAAPAPVQNLAVRTPLPPASPPASLQAPAPMPAPVQEDVARLFTPPPAPSALRDSAEVTYVPAPLPPVRAPALSRATGAAEPPRARSEDPIGALIRGEVVETASVSRAAEPDARVEAAQRALHHLGHGPLVADGVFGPATRSAIERFEQAQGLTVTGRLDPATVRALAVRSGIPID